MKKKKDSSAQPAKKWYVKVSHLKDISSRVDWNSPLDLNTILQLSKYGLLKEKKSLYTKVV